MANKVRKAKNFLRNDIWSLNVDELSKAKARFVRYVKVALITIKTFTNERIGFQAVALSFFSTMAVVPFVAIMFALTDGLGLAEVLKDLIYTTFDNKPEIIDSLLGFSQNLINIAQDSAMGLVSAIFFCFVVFMLMFNVEKVFNNVWKVKTRRSLIKRFSYILVIILLSPLVVIVFSSGSLIYSHTLDYLGINLDGWSVLTKCISWILFTGTVMMVFAFMYKFIPNADVSFRTALHAALPASIAFSFIQYIYLETQVLFSNLSTVYGAFAAVPLFMVWLNISWFIILIGAELSYAFQHVDNFNIED